MLLCAFDLSCWGLHAMRHTGRHDALVISMMLMLARPQLSCKLCMRVDMTNAQQPMIAVIVWGCIGSCHRSMLQPQCACHVASCKLWRLPARCGSFLQDAAVSCKLRSQHLALQPDSAMAEAACMECGCRWQALLQSFASEYRMVCTASALRATFALQCWRLQTAFAADGSATHCSCLGCYGWGFGACDTGC